MILGTASAMAAVLSFVAAVWAGLLVMLQESPDGRPIHRETPGTTSRRDLGGTTTRVARICLMLLAGFAASDAIGWWYRATEQGLVRLALAFGLLYMFAEGLPRSTAVLMPRVAVSLAPAARATLSPFVPLAKFSRRLESWLESLLPVRVRSWDRLAREHREMLHGIATLHETTVSDVMTPRLDIVAVESSANWKAVIDLLERSDHARIIVYTNDLDNVDGVLFAKDMTAVVAGVTDAPEDWREFVRQTVFVPESKVLNSQLRDFRQAMSGLAVVVDEFGGTSGLITLEDVLEEIVGEIYGEYDEGDETTVDREGDDCFWVDGGLTLDDLSDLLGVVIDREEVSTVGGLVYSELGRVPRPGEELRVEGFRVVVEQIRRRRIRRVYFERLPDSIVSEASRGDES